MIYTLFIEKCPADGPYPKIRGVIFDIDEETGSKSVSDIIETSFEGGEYLLDALASGFDGCKLDSSQVQRTDMGRATLRRTMIRKIMEQLP